ncbi:MarR family winged helix-turn-helix transcriptional regulator [Chitinophagaceae bacterium 26-R-25]|nr:MarR family winged helix-turn-helix transcriptional regulator [Chitinophagaceae bacterium 26-R-25]
MNAKHIQEIRSFNRFYTNIIGLLDRHILHSNYSLPEVRIMFELYHNNGMTASEIIVQIDIDKSYLSRILKGFEKNKLINKASSGIDKRAIILQLTTKGKKEFEALDKASEKQIATLFEKLSDKECNELVKKISEIQKLINKSLQHE